MSISINRSLQILLGMVVAVVIWSGCGGGGSDSRGPTVVGLRLDMPAEEVPAALAKIEGLTFKKSGGSPSPMVAVNGTMAVDGKIHQLTEAEGRFVLGDAPNIFSSPQLCYIPASMAEQVPQLIETLKQSLLDEHEERWKAIVKERLEPTKRELEQVTKLIPEAQEEGNRAWIALRDLMLSEADKEYRIRARRIDADAQPALNELTQGREQIRKGIADLKKDPSQSGFQEALKMLEEMESAVTELIAGKNPSPPGISQSPELVRIWGQFQDQGRRVRKAMQECEIIEKERLPEALKTIEAAFGDSVPLSRSDRANIIARLNPVVQPGGPTAAERLYSNNSRDLDTADRKLADAMSRRTDLEKAVSMLENPHPPQPRDVKVGNVVVGPSTTFVDDADQVKVLIAEGKVIAIRFSEAFSNAKFGASGMTDSKFLEEFCNAYDIPAFEAQFEAAADDAVDKAMSEAGGFNERLGRAATRQLTGGEARTHEDREAGYRFTMKGKTVILEAIQRTSDTSLGK